MVAAGFLLMIYNVTTVVRFIRDQRDVITGKNETVLNYVILAFVVCFAAVYAFIFFQNFEEMSIGIILLSGSAFVTVVLQWIYHLVGSIKANTMNMAEALSIIIDARDPDLRGHSRHVQELVVMMHEALPEQQRRTLNKTNLEYAAIFHDLGKLGVPESILNKPGPLTDEEWRVIRKHPKIGAEILRPVKSFDDIQDWIKYHHERADGKGYYQIPPDQIPLGAKIVAVADVFSALLMKRPYKASTSYDECIAVLKHCAGSQLDADIVDMFCAIPRERVLACSDVLAESHESSDVDWSAAAGRES